MFASIAKFRFTRPLTTADFEANERVLVPLLKSQPGYQGYVEVEAGERESISITLWASQSDAEHGLVAIRSQLLDLIGSALDGPPERSFGEVRYVDWPANNARI
ncbi:MAG: hypothetical protein JOZ81_26020 [Chloroflexi bacterium]|nr:hypothetical protein [Chloroflexota bacterium]